MFGNINTNFSQQIFNNIMLLLIKFLYLRKNFYIKKNVKHFLLSDVPTLYHIFTSSSTSYASNQLLMSISLPQEKKSRFERDCPECDRINTFL